MGGSKPASSLTKTLITIQPKASERVRAERRSELWRCNIHGERGNIVADDYNDDDAQRLREPTIVTVRILI
jgi:hypothetical protein